MGYGKNGYFRNGFIAVILFPLMVLFAFVHNSYAIVPTGGSGVLSLSKTEAFLNDDTIIITVIDADLNVSSAADSGTVKITPASGSDIYLTMTENNLNSGTFLGTFKTAYSTDDNTSPVKVEAIANGTITVMYQEVSPARDITANVSTKNFGAVLDITEDYIILGGNAVISLYDPESNTSISTKNITNINVRTSTDGMSLRLTETGNDTGSFLGTVEVSTSDTLINTRIQASVGDIITAGFTDNPNADGNISEVTDTATVVDENTILKPTVSTNSATNVTSDTATLNGTVNPNNGTTLTWFEYGLSSGIYDDSTIAQTLSGASDSIISTTISNLSASTTYYFRIVAENSEGTSYGNEVSFITNDIYIDTFSPSGSISINSGNSYTNSTNVTLKLSASDDVGITWYYISANSSTPSSSSSGWTSISSTTNYSASISYTLDGGDGSKTIYAWYMDDAGNISDTYSDSIILDTTPPEINITSPTTNDTYSTNISVVSIWGNASDATSGISTVKWENNKGGSGTASGTTSWSISNIGLLVDAENIITVTATDNAGNLASDSITVTYSELTAEPTTTSTTAPTPIIIPTNTITPTPTAIPTVTSTPKTTPTATPAELGAIFGSVVDTNGKPVANATIFTDKGGYSAKTGSNGIYQLNDVAEGSYLLTALAEGYGSVSQTVTVTAGETTQADFTLLRAITPPTPVPSLSPSVNPIPSTTPTPSTLSGKIFGYVMDEIDNPVKKAKVRCKGKNTKVKENATTNKQGYFEFNNLSADSYKITAKKKGFNKSKYNVNLEEGEEKEIEIVLEEK